MGSGGNAAGSGATQAGAVACTYGPQFIEASRPERRAARGPSTGSGAPALPVQHQEIVTESNEPSRVTVPAVSREAVSERMESFVGVVAAETCPRRKNVRLPGITCGDFR
jgi:hypothetical protein